MLSDAAKKQQAGTGEGPRVTFSILREHSLCGLCHGHCFIVLVSGAISGEFWRLEEGILKDVGDSLVKAEQLEKTHEQLEKTTETLERNTEQLAKDLDAVLGVIPKIEDSMLRTNHHVQDRLEQVVLDVGTSRTAMQLLEDKVSRVESELREEMEQRLLKQQRSITRQLESMSRVLMTDAQGRADAHHIRTEQAARADQAVSAVNHSVGSGLGGGTFMGPDSPFRSSHRAPSDRLDRVSDRPIERAASDRDRHGSPWNSARDRPSSDRGDRERERVPSPWQESDRDRGDRERDRPWSDRGSTDKSSLRLPVDSRRPPEHITPRSAPTALDSYRDRLSAAPNDSPRQSSAVFRGNSPESQSQALSHVEQRLAALEQLVANSPISGHDGGQEGSSAMAAHYDSGQEQRLGWMEERLEVILDHFAAMGHNLNVQPTAPVLRVRTAASLHACAWYASGKMGA